MTTYERPAAKPGERPGFAYHLRWNFIGACFAGIGTGLIMWLQYAVLHIDKDYRGMIWFALMLVFWAYLYDWPRRLPVALWRYLRSAPY